MKKIYHCADCNLIAECDPKTDADPPEGWVYLEAVDATWHWFCDRCGRGDRRRVEES